MGQFYGEISVIFFLSFRLKTAFSLLPFGAFVSTQRENMFLFESRLFLVVVAKSFFFAERKQAEQLFKFFASLSVFCFFSFVRFTRERLAF